MSVFEAMSAEDLAAPHNVHIGFDESRWDGLEVNPNYDVVKYGNLPEGPPPEDPNPMDGRGCNKYTWGGKDGNDNWLIDPAYNDTF